ncbi:3-hydroxyacyl-CoA dehydrogenase/enoyl-CoA hydratase/3-hydroxybutyryl-CoA epimerase [Panacagrimonas perspica]|uniref:3-hydroxyacyl-CoA dehydrogenase/enoyl-CoA hydratase/3-hydroxybutyryl-CoA epimerase n=1 Tax=Panacagrimonas perspica TaxID=381431 RepID=A0A4S3K595_9GAMM|nr:3-hydroxyacyl-CoA dehydrogenase NAD-binding domain-containing protein [Panacagrimonas perspica]TDU31462.1 3-hydroxyacyl-CoA dehydrogenase/enoyl-CoA hydratase/3-hydroxybutyryl-CoA epimerase [Panacagrimonas perspica]THD03292.1 3-hydroxyacyl-CoA dehydrogenase [Panacagrimonas perspica]
MTTSTSAVTFDVDADGIATISLDLPGRPMNVINENLMQPLVEAIGRVASDAAIKGAILTSGKKDFIAGADIDFVFSITEPKIAFDLAEDLKKQLRKIELCGKPFVAAMNGTTLGGGLEIALACHHRIAIDDAKTKIGLPEVKLGLLPGGGGTQRLPRLIGIQASAPLLLEGKELNPAAAKQQGLIHDLAKDRAELLAKAKAWCLANPKPIQPWDDKKFKFPGGDSKHPAVVQVLAIAPSMANAKTQGNYPAPRNILSAIYEGGIVDFDTGCRIESRYFAELVVSQVSKNMIGTLWFQLNGINKGKSRPAGIEKTKTQKVGILGAGMMGAGIAYVSAKVGMQVVLLDTAQESADKGKAYSAGLLDKDIKKGKLLPTDKEAFLSQILATTKFEDLAGCDLIIEAVFEDRAIKADVTKKTEAVLGANVVFASNTSTLPITGLAKAHSKAENFIGLHFFSPVDKMPLVEIIMGEKTSKETLAKGFDYVQQIRKTPIVVNDSRGFYTSRVFGTYISEGMALLAEGAHPRSIEVAGLQAGMPVGPLALSDEVSISLALHVLEQTRKDYAAEGKVLEARSADTVIEKMCRTLDRPGKKAGKGFYDYPAAGTKGEKTLWKGLAEAFPLAKNQPEQQELIDRMMFVQAVDAARCFEERVVTTVADTNIGSIFGWGFAPHQGGALQFINAYGPGKFVARAQSLAAKFGARFAPPKSLIEMAKAGKTYQD